MSVGGGGGGGGGGGAVVAKDEHEQHGAEERKRGDSCRDWEVFGMSASADDDEKEGKHQDRNNNDGKHAGHERVDGDASEAHRERQLRFLGSDRGIRAPEARRVVRVRAVGEETPFGAPAGEFEVLPQSRPRDRHAERIWRYVGNEDGGRLDVSWFDREANFAAIEGEFGDVRGTRSVALKDQPMMRSRPLRMSKRSSSRVSAMSGERTKPGTVSSSASARKRCQAIPENTRSPLSSSFTESRETPTATSLRSPDCLSTLTLSR